ncbi:DUF6069 family protein [Salinirubrum litoreum]|uniref:DUF6069 family protein n=1 Tax=Salinirubrum litoreum TaxID=1126234 RepID=A0ABD5RF32_9EURY
MSTTVSESLDSTTGVTTARFTTTAIVRRGALALLLSAAANALLLAAILASGAVPPFMALAYGPVIFVSLLGALGATVVYALLARRVTDPDRTFVRVAAVALLLSFAPNVALYLSDPAVTLGVLLSLASMHVVAAVASVGALTRGRDTVAP